ncbi:MAG TPA: C45 family peptidase [Beutenbergiaceae bacterium]|nr:C45 family peptidase [Beutenbergiaceae bacterium]
MSTGYPEATVIDASGSNTDIGTAHARATEHLRPRVQEWVDSTLATYPLDDPTVERRLDDVIRAWQDLTPGTVEQVGAMAEVYQIPARALLAASLGTYMRSLDRSLGVTDGCTTMAAPGSRPVLMKNRDNESRFLPMQTILRVRPKQGHPWLALSTAGAPAVHSSGINAAGLAIADTHVASRDIGPGVPRFSSMMHILEECTTTAEAVEYLRTVPQMGLGNLTMVDAEGHTAVVECAFSGSAVIHDVLGDRDDSGDGDGPGGGNGLGVSGSGGLRVGGSGVGGPGGLGVGGPGGDFPRGAVVATNHYVDPGLVSSLLEPEQGTPGADSRARRETVTTQLRQWGAGPDLAAAPDLAAVRALAATHFWPADAEPGQGEPAPGSLCKHGASARSETISTAVFDPVARTVDLCLGRPCEAPFVRIGFDGDPVPVPPAG